MLDRGMTVAAINAQDADMMFVTEWHRLHSGNALVGAIGGPRIDNADPHQERSPEERAEKAQLRHRIHAAMKNLGHRRLMLTGDCVRESPARCFIRAAEESWANRRSNSEISEIWFTSSFHAGQK